MNPQIRVHPRSFVEKNLPFSFFSVSPCFRGENVQRVRLNMTVISVSTSTGLSFR